MTDAADCPRDHDELERVDTLEWSTEPAASQFETAVFECPDCVFKRWERVRKNADLGDFGGATADV